MLSERQKMEALNYNYQQAQTYNILGRAADQLGGDAKRALDLFRQTTGDAAIGGRDMV